MRSALVANLHCPKEANVEVAHRLCVVDLNASTAVWTAANGDTITNQTTSFVLVEEVSLGVFRYEQTLVITGGTGRFANATGSATATGLINLVTGAYDGELTGVISRPDGG